LIRTKTTKSRHTDTKILENFPRMWGRNQAQSQTEEKIFQIFYPPNMGKISLVTRVYGPGPCSTPGHDPKKVKCFPFNEEYVCI